MKRIFDILKLNEEEAKVATSHLVASGNERIAGQAFLCGEVVATAPKEPVVLTQFQIAIQEILEKMGYERYSFKPTPRSCVSGNVLGKFASGENGKPPSDREWFHITTCRDVYAPTLVFDFEVDEQKEAA